MENERKSFAVLSSFILKIIAMTTMACDHVGWLLSETLGSNYWVVVMLRIIGRIALPLFCFMITEGVLHTKKPGHYFLRLGIMGTLISLAMVSVEYLPLFDGFSVRQEGNIFVDLLLGALAVYALRQDKWQFKLLAIIPVGIGATAFAVGTIEAHSTTLIHWFPFFLRPQYHFYGILMIVLFYFAYLLKDLFLKQYSQNSGIPVESLKGTNIERYAVNLFAVGMLLFATLGIYLLSFTVPAYWNVYIQNAAMIAGAFILLYSGKRGYNAKWFQYGSYLFYPLHLILIFGIGALVLM